MELLDFINKLSKEKQLEFYLAFRKDKETSYQTSFEDWIANEDNVIRVDYEWVLNDGTYDYCSNCGEWKEQDDMGSSELAMQDKICKDCMGDGYGR